MASWMLLPRPSSFSSLSRARTEDATRLRDRQLDDGRAAHADAVGAGGRRLLHGFEVHDRRLMIERRLQQVDLRLQEIALRLRDEKRRRQTGVEAPLLVGEASLGER